MAFFHCSRKVWYPCCSPHDSFSSPLSFSSSTLLHNGSFNSKQNGLFHLHFHWFWFVYKLKSKFQVEYVHLNNIPCTIDQRLRYDSEMTHCRPILWNGKTLAVQRLQAIASVHKCNHWKAVDCALPQLTLLTMPNKTSHSPVGPPIPSSLNCMLWES